MCGTSLYAVKITSLSMGRAVMFVTYSKTARTARSLLNHSHLGA
jgi:hypothetical protein